MSKKILWMVTAGALGALLAAPAMARAVAAWSWNAPAALALASPSPASLAVMAGLQGHTAGTSQRITAHDGAGELIAWAKLQDHLRRVETVWGAPFHQGPNGGVVPDSEAPPKFVIVRTFESPHDHAPLAEPLLGHAAIRFADVWGNNWLLPLMPLGQNFFWAEIEGTALIPWATLYVETLAWNAGETSFSPENAFYRSPLIGP